MQDTRLAAIMFTDIAGYSRLMEDDEVRTIALLHDHNELVFPVIEQASGTIVDAIGDGLLITFPSVLVAVRCALDIQDAVAARNETEPPERVFQLRIGIHLGEIWEDEGRIYGNGVNVAARTQPHARPGGVVVTEDVYRQVVNKISQSIQSIGRPQLRNIQRSIELYRVETEHEIEEPRVGAPNNGRVSAEADPEPSLDAVKERILQEREKIAARRERGEADSGLGQAIENRVFNLVDRAMDAAIEKWDKLPPEKRKEALESGTWQAGKTSPAGPNLTIRTGHRKEKKDSEDDKPGGEIATGAVFATGFGIGFFAYGIGWMIWPFVIIGVLPLLAGFRKLAKLAFARKRARQERPQRLERQILEVAEQLGGRVSVVQVSARTEIPLDETQETLDRMTARGYVSQEVLDNGTILYEFPSLADPSS